MLKIIRLCWKTTQVGVCCIILTLGGKTLDRFEETLDHFVEEKKSEVFNLSVSLKTRWVDGTPTTEVTPVTTW